MQTALTLRRARCLTDSGTARVRDVAIVAGRVRDGAPDSAAVEIDLDGRWLLPAFVNAYDVLDLAPLPPLGRPPYGSVYEWSRASASGLARASPLAIPHVDRLFLGGMRNLLAGVASVLHHHPDHRSLGRAEFPVRVQRRYGFAHSPGLTPSLRRSYRTSDRRIPWLVRAAEGSDPSLRGELSVLATANVLRQNTVIAHGTALEPADAAQLAEARASLVWCPESDLRLYGRTPAIRAFRAAGVCVGLGSDGAPAGARDFLSNLAVARRRAALDETTILELASRESAAVARMPLGGTDEGAVADLLATGSLEQLLDGDRRAVSLLLVRGVAVFGEPPLMERAGPSLPITIDGECRALAREPGRRFATLLRRHPAAREARWLATVAL